MNNHWPHAPPHAFNYKGTYIVTGATYYKQPIFKASSELDLLQNSLLTLAENYQIKMKAWAIFPNHYHFVAFCGEKPDNLRKYINHLHASTAREINARQCIPGRKVWYQCWDTFITYETSFYARLNYVIQNPVHHKIVKNAHDYNWCSANWFKENTTPAFYKTIINFKTDTVNVMDDFDV